VRQEDAEATTAAKSVVGAPRAVDHRVLSKHTQLDIATALGGEICTWNRNGDSADDCVQQPL
jgi:hypothetical protein